MSRKEDEKTLETLLEESKRYREVATERLMIRNMIRSNQLMREALAKDDAIPEPERIREMERLESLYAQWLERLNNLSVTPLQ